MRTNPRIRKARGFTLVEIAVVLIILAVLIGMAAMVTRGVTAAQKRSLTATRIATVDAALVQFVATQRRLPCPADGQATSGAGGVEMRNAGMQCTPVANPQQNGVVPWVTLGLSEVDATDGYDRRLTYRVDPRLVVDGGMDMSWCDPAGTELPAANPVTPAPRTCTPNCTSANLTACTPPNVFLTGRGFRIWNLSDAEVMNPNLMTGAAYAVISHGPTGGGSFPFGGGGNTGSVDSDGIREAANYATRAFDPAAAYHLVDDTPVEAAGTGHFDDVVSRPSVMAVITKAGLGPRAH